MEVHFKPELQAEIDRVAAGAEGGADGYVQQLVERHLAHDVWFRQKVSEGIDQLDRGEFLTEEDMDLRIAKMFRR
jgi:predicted transcriptional regulator